MRGARVREYGEGARGSDRKSNSKKHTTIGLVVVDFARILVAEDCAAFTAFGARPVAEVVRQDGAIAFIFAVAALAFLNARTIGVATGVACIVTMEVKWGGRVAGKEVWG